MVRAGCFQSFSCVPMRRSRMSMPLYVSTNGVYLTISAPHTMSDVLHPTNIASDAMYGTWHGSHHPLLPQALPLLSWTLMRYRQYGRKCPSSNTEPRGGSSWLSSLESDRDCWSPYAATAAKAEPMLRQFKRVTLQCTYKPEAVTA